MALGLGGGWFVDASMCGDTSKVWIGSPSGEGGDFDKAEFDAALNSGRVCGDVPDAVSRFFWENF